MKLTFLGAAGTVTGSCYLLTAESGQSIFIDCGLFQGTDELTKLNFTPLACDCSQVSGMVLTHAHLDHCGRLPMLLSQGFSQDIWMTPPTKDITEISLFDSAKINQDRDGQPVLYNKEDVEKSIQLFKTVEYDQTFTIGQFQIVMRDAGHILGSASLEVIDMSGRGEMNRVVFSGDLGNSPQDLICPTVQIAASPAVVMESTYGDRAHPDENSTAIIQSEINAIEASGGTLLIPAFSIERSQELLHRISHLKRDGKVKNTTPIFFDSPMAEKVTTVFEQYPQYYNDEFKEDFKKNDPFNFPGLTVVERHNRQGLGGDSEPKVIVAGSGMMTGGRIVHHAAHYLPINSTRLLIVGYQADGTLGRLLLDGQKTVMIEGHMVPVNAMITQTQGMSSHADQPKLLKWLDGIAGVKKVFLTHGDDMPRATLAAKIANDLNITDISMPLLNKTLVI